MTSTYRLYQVSSFTRDTHAGNPAGVVSNAEGMEEEQMQQIAREMNCSETAFVLPGKKGEYDVAIRYFTPTVEVPVCGHATIAAHYVRAVEAGRKATENVLQRCGIGLLPIEVTHDGEDYRVTMTQGMPEFGDLIEGINREKLIQALGLQENDLDSRCPIQIASTGHSKVMIGIKSKSQLNNLSPDLQSLKALSGTINCKGYFVFTFDSDNSEILTHGRMFAPAIGINEDPVTGNAHGPLGAYLIQHKLVPHDGKSFSFKGQQGEAMGRKGTVEVKVAVLDEKPVKVQISGEAVIVFSKEIEW